MADEILTHDNIIFFEESFCGNICFPITPVNICWIIMQKCNDVANFEKISLDGAQQTHLSN
jgi:hypothetical protein